MRCSNSSSVSLNVNWFEAPPNTPPIYGVRSQSARAGPAAASASSTVNSMVFFMLAAESEGHADGGAPVMEILEAEVLVDEVVVFVEVVIVLLLERAEVPQVAAEAEVVVEEDVHAAAEIDPELVGAEILE